MTKFQEGFRTTQNMTAKGNNGIRLHFFFACVECEKEIKVFDSVSTVI